MVAFVVDGDIQVEDVAIKKDPLIRDTVTDNFVD
jgi:hypothetical protein